METGREKREHSLSFSPQNIAMKRALLGLIYR